MIWDKHPGYSVPNYCPILSSIVKKEKKKKIKKWNDLYSSDSLCMTVQCLNGNECPAGYTVCYITKLRYFCWACVWIRAFSLSKITKSLVYVLLNWRWRFFAGALFVLVNSIWCEDLIGNFLCYIPVLDPPIWISLEKIPKRFDLVAKRICHWISVLFLNFSSPVSVSVSPSSKCL